MLKTTFLARIKNNRIQIADNNALKVWISQFKDGTFLEIVIDRKRNKRTNPQNNSIHLYCKQTAESLNAAGLTIEKVVKYFTMEHEWSMLLVKDLLWREAQRYAVQKESTTELDKLTDINKVWEIMNRFLAKMKVESIPFPSIETQFDDLAK